MHPICTTIQILKINQVESGVAKQSQKPYDWHTAECVLFNDSGTVVSVGRLVFPKELRESLGGMPSIGTYRASISLVVSKSGAYAGDIIPQITGLTPVNS